MPGSKRFRVEKFYGVPFSQLIVEQYVGHKLTAIEVTQKIKRDCGVVFSDRYIQATLKKLGVVRSFSEAFRLSIARGRKTYDKLRKPIKSNESRFGISLRVRYEILKRDRYRCILCGVDASNSLLVIDHIIPVVQGGTNESSNLRVLCRACNHGKKQYEHER